MAYGIRVIPIIDTRPSTGVGVKIPFSSDSVFTTVYTTKEQTKYNLINYLLSDPRERPFNPTFGSGLRSRIFEHITTKTTEEIQLSLTNKVESFFPNVKVETAEVTVNPDLSTINIKFSYRLLNTSETDEINIEVQR